MVSTRADINGEAGGSRIGDLSGFSVSLSSDGSRVAIGAHLNDGTSGNENDQRGHVRIYQYNNNSWSQLGADIDGKRQVMPVAIQFLYLLTDQG